MVQGHLRTLLLTASLIASLTACDVGESQPALEIAPGVRLFARISDPRIKESSGVIASRRYADVFWTHNDGGGPKKQVLYAIDDKGATRAAFPVTGPMFHDWEDIAIDDAGHLYLGDIGNNESREESLAVYEIDEPDPRAAGTRSVSPRRGWRLKFPGRPFDCESLFVWKGYGYVISKVFNNAPAQVFRFPLTEANEPLTLQLVATTKIKSPVTGSGHLRRRTPAWRRLEGRRLRLSHRWRRGSRCRRAATLHKVNGQAHRRLFLAPGAARHERAAGDSAHHQPFPESTSPTFAEI